jgi:tetratricopeptide (TPR) repeat protein
LSENSVKSTFVDDEVRAALEARSAGRIRDVLIFSIDGTSYSQLPNWLKEINVAQHLRSPKQIARRIDATLMELSLKEGILSDFYFGRENEELIFRQALAKPKASSPIAVHVVGNHGVGRKTFLRKSLSSVAPRNYAAYVEIPLDEYESVTELYRKLYDVWEVYNPLTAGEAFLAFKNLSDQEKISEVSKYIRRLAEADTLPVFVDDGGVFQDDGDYHPHFPLIFNELSDIARPTVSFIQARMMRHSLKQRYLRSFHIRIPSLSDETVYQLLCMKLKELEIDFTESEVRKACEFTDGHPYNINLVVSFIADIGFDIFLANPSEIIEIKSQRGHDFIKRIQFSELEADIVAVLHEYRYCDLEFLLAALEVDANELTEAVRRLEDFCCIERKDRMITLSPPIRDAVRRDKRFGRTDDWLGSVGRRIVAAIKEYESSESLSISFLDSAIPEILRSGSGFGFVSALILPSHFLRVGRDYYDKGNFRRSIEFCQKALEGDAQLSMDAKIEASRLLGLAITRLNPDDLRVNSILDKLRSYGTTTSKRVGFFIEGFRARRKGRYDVAEEKFKLASQLDKENYHINRELSSVLCRLGRFAEAEPFARAAYNRSPDNPYIVDVLIESLEGMAQQGLAVNGKEIARLNGDLEAICTDGGFHFHKVRNSRKLYGQSKQIEAISMLAKVISGDRNDLEAHFRRGQMYVRSHDLKRARNDIARIRTMGESETDAFRYADELEVDCLIAESRFVEAKSEIETKFGGASGIEKRLYRSLVSAIAYAPSGVPQWLKDWSKQYR